MPPIVIDLSKADDSRDVVHRAVQALAEGKLVAFATETVYGIGASGCRPEAVERLKKIKSRGSGSPFALAIKSAEEAIDYVPDMVPLARRLARRCWPGPVTLVVDDQHESGLSEQLPPSVREAVCPNGTLGLRVSANRMLLDVLRMLAGPVVLTSANRRDEPDAVTAEEVLQAVGEDVTMVLDDGPCRYRQPSSVVRVYENRFEILRQGVVGEETLRRLSNLMVLFICTGNTCRSPMAELLMRKTLAKSLMCELDELEDRGILVRSAGLAAVAGCPPSAEAVQVMEEQDSDLTPHQSQPISEPLVRHADLILTMTTGHMHLLVDRWPEAADRTFTLLSESADVSDPIGQSIDVYRHCANQISSGVEYHAKNLLRQLDESANKD